VDPSKPMDEGLLFYFQPILMTDEGWILFGDMMEDDQRPTMESILDLIAEMENEAAEKGWTRRSDTIGDIERRIYSNLHILVGTNPQTILDIVEETNRLIQEDARRGILQSIKIKKEEAA